MKKRTNSDVSRYLKGFIFLWTLFLVGCATLHENERWDFIQSVGGISIGEPKVLDGTELSLLYKENDIAIPVNFNISGTTTITTKPTQVTNDLMCRAINRTQNNYEITFTVLVSKKYPIATPDGCKYITFDTLSDGVYSVFYQSKNDVERNLVGKFEWKNK